MSEVVEVTVPGEIVAMFVEWAGHVARVDAGALIAICLDDPEAAERTARALEPVRRASMTRVAFAEHVAIFMAWVRVQVEALP